MSERRKPMTDAERAKHMLNPEQTPEQIAVELEAREDGIACLGLEATAKVMRDAAAALRRQSPEAAHKPTCRSWRCGWQWRTDNGSGVCRLPRDSEIHYIGTVDSHEFVKQSCDCGKG